MGMRIDRLILREIRMPLVHFFETSFGRTTERRILLVELVSGGVSGWGEITCGENPFYNEEWTDSAWLIVRDYLAPQVLHREFASAAEVADRFAHIRGHRMARGGVEASFWDLEARLHGVSLAKQIGGGAFSEIACGVSIGIQDSVPQLLRKIETELKAGYRRIKIKIRPGWDIDVIRQLRAEYPDIPLMADANSAYTLADRDRLKCLDEFHLMMIEQPLGHDEILDHAALQAQIGTPICLDECIRTAHHAEQAIRMGACRIINIKLGRVGGFREAKRIHDLAQSHGIPVWCGGMLESGIGRAHNVALSTLPNFVLPGDVSASKRYWDRDIVRPPIEVSPQGAIRVPTGPGFGYEIDSDFLKESEIRRQESE
ncbi:MAG TPA: o-succinylbenzoate synthase [Bryobacteraceae bacterium]|nr:o-succinylbenzoate synthase [Bryobacteraceae bacterium]